MGDKPNTKKFLDYALIMVRVCAVIKVLWNLRLRSCLSVRLYKCKRMCGNYCAMCGKLKTQKLFVCALIRVCSVIRCYGQ